MRNFTELLHPTKTKRLQKREAFGAVVLVEFRLSSYFLGAVVSVVAVLFFAFLCFLAVDLVVSVVFWANATVPVRRARLMAAIAIFFI